MKKNKKAQKKAAPAKRSAGRSLAKVPGMPYGDRVLVQPAAAEERTSFGIIIPDSTKEKPEQGTVVAVGPGKKTDEGKVVPLSVTVGDRIMFSKYGYEEVTIDGVEYYLIREDSITFVF